jgi:hypothetical protein
MSTVTLDDVKATQARLAEMIANLEAQQQARTFCLPAATITLQPVDRGVDFVGHVIKPWHTRTRRRTFHEALRRTGAVPAEDLHATANSYFGLLRQATRSHHDRARLANTARRRGHCVNFDLTKIYRRAA